MIRLQTSGGPVLELEELDRTTVRPPCDLCKVNPATVTVRIYASGAPTAEELLDPLDLCGDEVAAALAVRLGAAHVRAGGNLTDLGGAA